MKAMDIIDRLDGLEPNQYSPEQKLRWLSILDGNIRGGTAPEGDGAQGLHGVRQRQ